VKTLEDAAPDATAFAPESAWTDVCALAELEPFWGEAALIAGHQIAVVRLPDDQVFAVGNLDPIADAHVMSRGIVGSRGDRPTLASPLHKEVYNLATGERLGADGPGLGSFPVRVVDGRVEVFVPGGDG
jgi:nitrite reductase (NADH) small subunit